MHNHHNTREARSGQGNAFAMGLLCGAAVGAAAALLFAPKSGEDLRGQIADTAEGLRQRARDKYQEASGAVNDLVDRGQDAIRRGQGTIDDARSVISDVMNHGREAVKRGREKYEETRAEFAEQ